MLNPPDLAAGGDRVGGMKKSSRFRVQRFKSSRKYRIGLKP
jgi:hypothetical protein